MSQSVIDYTEGIVRGAAGPVYTVSVKDGSVIASFDFNENIYATMTVCDRGTDGWRYGWEIYNLEKGIVTVKDSGFVYLAGDLVKAIQNFKDAFPNE